MSNKQSNNSKIFKILKGIGWLFFGIVVLLIVLLIAVQTPFAKKQIVRIAENQVNELLNGKLNIGELSGNFFAELKLNDILLESDKNDTLAFISSVDLKYDLLPLIRGKIHVKEAVVENPYVFLKQINDSTWNVMQILKPSEDKDTTSSAFNMLVLVDKFALNNGNIKVETPIEQIPKQIKDLFILLSGKYATEYQELDVKDFRFNTLQPDFTLQNLILQAKADKKMLTINDFLLQTAQNELKINGEYSFDNSEKSTAELKTNPIALDEFKFFLPAELDLQINPVIALNAELEKQSLSLDLSLSDNNQGIEMKLLSEYLIEYFSDSTAVVTYDLALNADKIDLAYWLNNSEYKYLIDGKLTAKGEGLNPETMTSNVKGNFGNIILYGNPVQQLDLALSYKAGDVVGEIDGLSSFGSVRVKPVVKRILGDRPVYQVVLNTRELNLYPISGNKNYESNLNLDASVDGSGFDLNKINAKGLIAVFPSQIAGFDIDTIYTDVEFRNQNITVNSLLLKALSAQLNAVGNYNLKGNSEFNLDLKLNDAKEISKFLDIEGLETSADLKAHLYGNPNDLKVDANLAVGKSEYNDMLLDSIVLVANANVLESKIDIKGNAQANRFAAGEFVLDSIKITAETDTENVILNLNAAGKDIQTKLNGAVKLGEIINIALSDLWLNYRDYEWNQSKDTAFVNIGKNEYEIKNFRLISQGADTLQSVSAEGKISMTAEQDFDLNIKNIDISKVIKTIDLEQDVKGLFNFDFQVGGTAQSPLLNGKLDINNLSLGTFLFDAFEGDIFFKNKKMEANMNVVPKDNGSLNLTGRMPMNIRLDSMLFDIQPKETDSVYLKLLIDKLPLSIVNAFFPTDVIDGHIQSNILMNGTFGNPGLSGSLNVNQGKLGIKKYGVDYKNIQAAVNLAENAIKIDTFLIQSHDGDMKMGGDIVFQSEIYKADLNTSELKISFNRFNPIDHKYYNMELSGNVDLNANKDSLLFSGDLDIPESYFYLPALLGLFGDAAPAEIPKPLLVTELEKMQASQTDSVTYTVRPDSVKAKTNKLAFLDNLQGDLRVKIPRNTWIRNDDMRFELSGDVEIMKHKEYFELFGTVDIVRGQYTFIGKTFVVQSGTITFQGGEELNPLLSIEAVYSFRDSERNKRDLTLHVSGDLSSPEIKFTYEGKDISEGDAISYILFGTNMDALTAGQQESAGGIDAANIAESLAASLISSQLTKILGNAFKVDYIEFKSDSSFESASFTVGKYITNKLFVSYEQNIGHIDDTNVARYEMTMEYELFKFLFLQLTSSSLSNGVDVIFKLNSK